MTVAEEIGQFANEISEWPDAVRTEIHTFPSGAAMLDVFIAGRLFVLAYLPTDRLFGVDEARPEDGIGSDYRFGFADFSAAKQKMIEMLHEARVTVPYR